MNKRDTWKLLKQERFILKLLKCNFSEKEVAEQLNISIHSVKSHVARLEKLGLWKVDFLK